MKTESRRKPFFDRLKSGLEESLAHARGELSLRTIEVPSAPPEIDPKNVAALRERAGMSQAVFASVLNVSAKTVQSWEQGVRRPSPHVRRLIQVFSERPDVFCDIIGMTQVQLKGVRVVDAGRGRRKIVVGAG